MYIRFPYGFWRGIVLGALVVFLSYIIGIYEVLSSLAGYPKWVWAALVFILTYTVVLLLPSRFDSIRDSILSRAFVLVGIVTFLLWLIGSYNPGSLWKWSTLIVLWSLNLVTFLGLLTLINYIMTIDGE